MLFTRGYDDIYSTIYQDLVENTPITNLTESSTARALVESVARRMTQLYRDIESYSNAAYLSTATGEFLDKIGQLHGVTRRQSTRAYSGDRNFRFYIDPATGYTTTDLLNLASAGGSTVTDITIKQGTMITTGSGDVSYTTSTPVVLQNTDSFVNVVATGTGGTFNVGPGTLRKHNITSNQLDLATIATFILCTNDEAVESGNSFESDSNYRARISEARLSNLNANEASIRNAALSVPGVADVVLGRYPEGIGTFNVIVLTEYPIASTAVLNAVHEAVNQVSAYGSRAIVSTPEYLAIELKLKLHWRPRAQVEDQDSVKAAVRTAIIDYTNNIEVGGQWIVNEVIQRVMEVSDLILDTEQQWFRVHRYFSDRTILATGRAQVEATVNQLQRSEGTRMIWTNQRCKAANPPQKFLMLGKHLVIC